jgi:hypothetical protein
MENSYCSRKPIGCELLTVSITKEIKDQLETIKRGVLKEGMSFNTSAFVREMIGRELARIADQYRSDHKITA